MNQPVRILGLCVAIMSLFMVQSVSAQRTGGDAVSAPFGSLVYLIQRSGVQKELGITDEAVKKLVELARQIETKQRAESEKAVGDRQSFLQLPEEERERVHRRLHESFKRYREERWKGFQENLSTEQFQRLQEISRQMLGPLVLNDHLMSEPLELTKDQQQRLEDVTHEYSRQCEAVESQRRSRTIDAVAERMKIHELGEELSRNQLEVLTEEQRAKLEELKGKPFNSGLLKPAPQFNVGAADFSSGIESLQLLSLIENAERMRPSRLPDLAKDLGIDEEKLRNVQELFKQNRRDMQKARQFLQESFTEKQRQRLREILWQQSGSLALNPPMSQTMIQRSLDLTLDQQRQLSVIHTAWDRKNRELGPFNSANKEQVAKINELLAERNQKSIEVLTADQRKKFEELLGKPFDLQQR